MFVMLLFKVPMKNLEILSNKQAIYFLRNSTRSYVFVNRKVPNVSFQSFNLYSLVSMYVRDNDLSLEMILLPTQTLVLYLISDCNILWRMFDETNRCFIWFANKSTEWFDCRKISYQNSPDALTHCL